MKKIKLAVIIYTYNRVEDAKINMEIIRNVWSESKKLEIKIIHCFNGEKPWYPKKYLEDDLIYLKNSGHIQGASELIDAGINIVQKKYKETNYTIVMASDTWLIKPGYLEKVLQKMKSENKYLASCPWGLPECNDLREVGIAVDFFIINQKWARKYKMFPVNYGIFFNKYSDLFFHQGWSIILEKLILGRFIQAVFNESKINVGLKQHAYQKFFNLINYGIFFNKYSDLFFYQSWGVVLEKLMLGRFIQSVLGKLKINVGLKQHAYQKFFNLIDRDPVHSHIGKDGYWVRKMYWPKIGLLTYHEALPKKQILKKAKIIQGESIKKLLRSKSFDYFFVK